jgi:hypothetical protein
MSHVKYLMEHADELIPVLYDHARSLAKRKYRWREGKSLPLGKMPEDIVSDVYVSYIKGAGSEGRRIKGARHFDPEKDIMLQLKGAIRSALWALTDRASAQNEQLGGPEESESHEIEFAPTESNPAERAEFVDFAKVAVERLKSHQEFVKNKELQDLYAAFDLGITDTQEQCNELGKSPNQIAQLRFQLRQVYLKVIEQLNNETVNLS